MRRPELGRHSRLTSTWVLKQWLLVLPLLLAVLVGILLATASGPAAYAMVGAAVVLGVVLGLTVLPAGEGRAANPGLTFAALLVVLPGTVVVAAVIGADRLYLLGCVVVCAWTYTVTSAARIVRRRGITWGALVAAPWRR